MSISERAIAPSSDEVADLDDRVARLDPLIDTAAEALQTFYVKSAGEFLRESAEVVPRKIDPTWMGGTSTARSFFALFEYLRMRYEEGRDDEDLRELVKRTVRGAKRFLSNPQRARFSANGTNMFTDSHYLLAASALGNTCSLTGQAVPSADILSKAASVAKLNEANLEEWRGGRVAEDDSVHHFISLHCVRGLDAFSEVGQETAKWAPSGPLCERVRDDVIKHIGYASAGVNHRFDPAELAFATALLNRTTLPEAPRLTAQAIDTIANVQTEDGAWPTARVISYRAQKLLHVSSHEVALTLADLLVRVLGDRSSGKRARPYAGKIIAMLDKAVELVESTYEPPASEQLRAKRKAARTTEGFSGWANDRTQGRGRVESWVTAIVLTFLLHYRDALLIGAQREILAKYGSGAPEPPRPQQAWPDLAPALVRTPGDLSQPTWPISDPTAAGTLEERVKAVYLVPVVRSPIRKPETASLILYGPPGTRKTSLVDAIAQCLDWPLVTLTPPDFLRQGFEGFERSADEIFRDLGRLRRVVILFDECEDFFKRRPTDPRTESRTIGAFITAGMLPRLQELRVRSWVIFVLATNVEIEDLDEAVTRRGRFDHAQRLDHPVPDAQIRYLKARPRGEILTKAIGAWTSGRSDGAKIPFTTLDDLAKRVGAARRPPTAARVKAMLDELVEASGPPPLA